MKESGGIEEASSVILTVRNPAIVVKNGEAVAIKTSGDVVDIEVVDTDNGTTVHYSSYEGDGAPIWVGGSDDECPFDPDPVPENN